MPRRFGTRESLLGLMALALLFGTTLPSPAQDARTLPRKPIQYLVPANTLALITLPNIPEARTGFNRWSFKKLYDEPTVQAFLKPLVEQLEEARQEAADQVKKQTGLDLDRVIELFRGQVSLALIDIDLAQVKDRVAPMLPGGGGGGPGFGPQGPGGFGPAPEPQASGSGRPRILFAIDVDRSTQTFSNAFSWFKNQLAKEQARFTAISYGGVEIMRVRPQGDTVVPQEHRVPNGDGDDGGAGNDGEPPRQPRAPGNDNDNNNGGNGAARGANPNPQAAPAQPDDEFFYTVFNQTFFITLDLATLKATIDAYRSPLPDGTLAREAKYRKVRARLGQRGEVAFAYGNLERLLGMTRAQLDDDEQRQAFDKVLQATGIKGLKALGANLLLREGNLIGNAFLYCPGVRRGFLQAISLPPTKKKLLVHVPRGAVSLELFEFDLEILWLELLRVVESERPDEYLRLKEELDRMADDGLDLANGLFAALGGEVASFVVPHGDGPLEQTMIAELKGDRAKDAAKLLRNLVAGLAKEEPKLAPTESTVGEATVYTFKTKALWDAYFDLFAQAGGPGGPKPNTGDLFDNLRDQMGDTIQFGVVKNWFVLTNRPQAIDRLQKSPGGLAEHLGLNPAFTQALARTVSNPGYFRWSDSPRLFGSQYDQLTKALKLLAKSDAKPELPVVLDAFPPQSALTKYMKPEVIAVLKSYPDGVLLRGTISPSAELVGGGIGMLVAFANIASQMGGGMPGGMPGGQPGFGPGAVPQPGRVLPEPPRILPPGGEQPSDDERERAPREAPVAPPADDGR